MFEKGGGGEVASEDGRDGEREKGNGGGGGEEKSKPKSFDLKGKKEEEKDVEDGGIRPSRR